MFDLIVRLYGARNLVAADSNGKSDPYAVVKIGSVEKRSKVIPKTLNPEWTELYLFEDVEGSDILQVELFDRDIVGKHEQLGLVRLQIQRIVKVGDPEKKAWYTLDRTKHGQVEIGLLALPKNWREIQGDEFNPADYVFFDLCMNKDLASELPEYYAQLRKEKEETDTILKLNLYQNYEKFITGVREIQRLLEQLGEVKRAITSEERVISSLAALSVVPKESSDVAKSTGANALFNKFRTKELSDDIDRVLVAEDRLDVLINGKKFEEAVREIEYVSGIFTRNPNLARVVKDIYRNIEERKRWLAFHLLSMLQTAVLKTEQRRIMNYLIRLGEPRRALAVYLENRRGYIRAEMRKLKAEGDVIGYIADLSKAVFGTLNSVLDDFNFCFTPASDNATLKKPKPGGPYAHHSTFVRWVVDEVDRFGRVFRANIISSGDFKHMHECLKIFWIHCRVLERKGLDMSFTLNKLFRESLIECIDALLTRGRRVVDAKVTRETWTAKRVNVALMDFSAALEASDTAEDEGGSAIGKVKSTLSLMITDSARQVFITLQEFIGNVLSVMTSSAEIVLTVVSRLGIFFEGYFKALLKQLESPCVMTDRAALAMLASATHLVDHLLPHVSAAIKAQCSREIVDLDRLQYKIEGRLTALQEAFCSRRAKELVASPEMLDWPRYTTASYGVDKAPENAPQPLAAVQLRELFVYLRALYGKFAELLPPVKARPVIERLIETILAEMANTIGPLIGTPAGTADSPNVATMPTIGHAGLQLLSLDMQFYLAAAGRFLTDDANKVATDLIKRAVTAYCKAHHREDPTDVLLPPEWFYERTRVRLAETPKLELGNRSVAETNAKDTAATKA